MYINRRNTWKKLFSSKWKKTTDFTVRCTSTLISSDDKMKSFYDVIIVGGGHNGLVSAAYLARGGLSVAVMERRHLIGGAAVTEEIIEGFKFSRASYALSLLRPIIIQELQLKKHGLKLIKRTTNSLTPIRDSSKSLLLGVNEDDNYHQIAQFSTNDAKKFGDFCSENAKFADIFRTFLDHKVPDRESSNRELLENLKFFTKAGWNIGKDFSKFYQFITSPISKRLDRWFDTNILKSTLSVNSVIGTMNSPYLHGSSYVAIHNEVGEIDGEKGAWGLPQGGMGSVSEAIASSAKSHGAHIFVNSEIDDIAVKEGKATGVHLKGSGRFVEANYVLSNATPFKTWKELLKSNEELSMNSEENSEEYWKQIEQTDYSSPSTKINVAVDRLPSFKCFNSNKSNTINEHLKGIIHLNCESMQDIHDAYIDAKYKEIPSARPLIEMMIPSTLDTTLSPSNKHVIMLFIQYTPYYIQGRTWSYDDKLLFANKVFSDIDEYAPGFSDSIIGYDMLTPQDLEATFGLTGGNVSHGALSLDQVLFTRPTSIKSSYQTPIDGLYLCGSGTHPGGGVSGASGRLCALTLLNQLKSNM